MRTNVTLDSKIIEQLQQATETPTKSKAVIIAVEDYLRRLKVRQIKSFAGRLRFRKGTPTSRHHVR